jgi:hypothetical protein
MAFAYCSPRNTSSASRSRCTAVRQTGIATLSMIAITLMPTSNAAIAYPFWGRMRKSVKCRQR